MLPDLVALPAGANFGSMPAGELTGITKALAPFKSRLTLITRMAMLSAMDRESHNNHDTSHTNLLTGAGPSGGSKTKQGPSIDQIVAAGLKDPGPVRSIELGDRLYAGGFSGLAKGTNAPVISSPTAIFKKLFDGVNFGGAQAPTEAALVAEARGEALDMARARYGALAQQVSGEDKQKLEQHLQFLSDYRRRLQAASSTSCDAISAGSPSGFMARTKEWARLTAHAMACNVTRVATMQLSLGPSDYGSGGDLHQDHAHNSGNASNVAAFRKYNTTASEAFAAIVNEFAQRDLLDSTLLVWVTEHGVKVEAHSLTDTHALTVGNMNGYFKTGSHIQLPKQTQPQGARNGGVIGVPHNHFLVSLARGMGLDIDRVNLESHLGVSLRGEMAQFKA